MHHIIILECFRLRISRLSESVFFSTPKTVIISSVDIVSHALTVDAAIEFNWGRLNAAPLFYQPTIPAVCSRSVCDEHNCGTSRSISKYIASVALEMNVATSEASRRHPLLKTPF